MHELEALLRLDKEAGVPEPADAAFTAAAVRRRLGRAGPVRAPRRAAGVGWFPGAVAACMVVALVAAALRFGLDGYWLLLAVPMAGAAALPILLRKGV